MQSSQAAYRAREALSRQTQEGCENILYYVNSLWLPFSSTEAELSGCGPFKERSGGIRSPAPVPRREGLCCTARALFARGSGSAGLRKGWV